MILKREKENKVLTLKQKRQVSKYIRANYSVSNIRFGVDGAVTANRANKRGRFFMGWDIDLLQDSEKEKGHIKMQKFFAEVIIENNVHCKVYEFCLQASHYSRALAIVIDYLIDKGIYSLHSDLQISEVQDEEVFASLQSCKRVKTLKDKGWKA